VKFQPDLLDGVNHITRFDGDSLRVGAEVFRHSVVVPWVGAVRHWPVVAADALTEAHFEALLALQPEVVIFGSGARLQFVPPRLHRALIAQRIGLETMDSGAACRTYNVLASEGRRVVAALLLPPAPD